MVGGFQTPITQTGVSKIASSQDGLLQPVSTCCPPPQYIYIYPAELQLIRKKRKEKEKKKLITDVHTLPCDCADRERGLTNRGPAAAGGEVGRTGGASICCLVGSPPRRRGRCS